MSGSARRAASESGPGARALRLRPRAEVTFVVTARDEQRWIRRALWSLRRQAGVDLEIVVVDDGSTDATADVVRDVARVDRRVRLVVNDGAGGHGAAAAANLGLDHCATRYVGRLDADDLTRRHRTALQLAELRRNPLAVAVGTYGLRVNEWGVPIGRLRNGPVGSEGYHRAMRSSGHVNLTHSSVMYRRSAVEEAGRYPREYVVSEDVALFNRLARLGEVYAIPSVLTIYTVRRGSISSQHLFEEELAALRVRQEAQRGEAYPSLQHFLDDVGASSVAWRDLEERVHLRVAQRTFSRALVNGQVRHALDAARSVHDPRALVGRAVRKALTGRG